MGIFNKRLGVGWKSIAWVMDTLSFYYGWIGPHIAALIKNSAFHVFEEILKKTKMLLKNLLKYSKIFSVSRKIC